MHIRSLLVSVGLATAVGVGSLVVVSVASADDGGTAAATTTAAIGFVLEPSNAGG